MKKGNRIIIGLVGRPSSGKDTVAEYIVEKYGFTHVSLSNLIRQYVAENKLGEQTKEMWHNTGNMLREKYGPDHLATLALATEKSPLVISGIRSIGEANKVKGDGGKILAIISSIEFRYRLAKNRGRIGDDSFEKFKQIEEAEANSMNPYGMSVDEVIKIADFTIQNEGTMGELHQKIDEIMAEIA